ncbi:MAG: MobC family plasmid mobilization relaxosome protein [Oscillibacter sp.]|nr:MobC family plasmid mobilization relaxosome protein [Oscillibacter sp.]
MKKDTTFSIRISSEDLATIQQKAKDARLSQSEYVTRCCLGRQIVIMDGLKEVLQQQRAIGNNLNRLTVLANMGRVTAVDLERTAQELATISSTLRDIQERARRSG